MAKKKIACVVGARPQFIKHFPLELELRKKFEVVTIHIGQHYDASMSSVFFDQLKIKRPDFHFKLTQSSHGGQTVEILSHVENVLLDEGIEVLLVYGDTNSTIAGSLVAAKLNIPIVHIEAGLRSFNRAMPEEVNRVIADHVSNLLFCSSEVGAENLKSEGISKGVHICGDLMKDSLLKLRASLTNTFDAPFIIATLHRSYNTDNPKRLISIIQHFDMLEARVILPLHPRTRNALNSNGLNFRNLKNVELVEPVGYLQMLTLLRFSEKVITDSGGIQKEAYWLQKKCITVRPETEWIETLVGNWNTLVFEDLTKMGETTDPDITAWDQNLYGNDEAASEITEIISKHFGD